MPELAEVAYYQKQWQCGLNARIERVLLHPEKRIFRGTDTQALAGELPGTTFQSAYTHGKQMIFRFGTRHWLGIHLGMTGRLRSSQTPIAPGKHDHLVIKLEKGTHLIFADPRMFGRVLYHSSETPPDWWTQLPPEILSPEFTQDRLNHFLDRRKSAPIKAVLLMQETFPGIGNWMADEILWRTRIHPALPCAKIGSKKRKQLFAALREVCADALEVIAENWKTPPNSWLFNHRWKEGGQCPRTGAPLRREPIGGRTTCWSPKWQTYRG